MALLPSWWVGMGAMQRREARAGLLFVLPWLLSLVIFTAYPALTMFYLSLLTITSSSPPHGSACRTTARW